MSHSGSGNYNEQVFGGLGVGLQAVVSSANDDKNGAVGSSAMSIGGEVAIKSKEEVEASNAKNRHHAKPKVRTRSSKKKDAKARSIGHY